MWTLLYFLFSWPRTEPQIEVTPADIIGPAAVAKLEAAGFEIVPAQLAGETF